LPVSLEENMVLDGIIEEITTIETVQFIRGDTTFTKVFIVNTGLGLLLKRQKPQLLQNRHG
jgi:hypothetical protein